MAKLPQICISCLSGLRRHKNNHIASFTKVQSKSLIHIVALVSRSTQSLLFSNEQVTSFLTEPYKPKVLTSFPLNFAEGIKQGIFAKCVTYLDKLNLFSFRIETIFVNDSTGPKKCSLSKWPKNIFASLSSV